MRHARTIIRWLLGWVWTPLMARGALWLGAFVALAHVGSGAAVRALGPPQASAGVARAAPRAPRGVGVVASTTPCPQPAKGVVTHSPLDLNQASAEELQALPGIGAKRAQAIVALRDRLGGFRRVADLARVRGIGYRSLQRLSPLVKVGPRQRRDADAGAPR